MANPVSAMLVPGHHALGPVAIGADEEAGAAGQVEEGQHVAGRQRRHQHLLGIDARRVRPGQRHHRRRSRAERRHPAVERQGMGAAVAPPGKVGPGLQLPVDDGDVGRHATSSRSRWGTCGSGRRRGPGRWPWPNRPPAGRIPARAGGRA
ncbi:conserved hypothetical protein [Ricinus communis]|uniref:Uncharacterized protein n=1 Tax=Ricinus communis TaxID=3988 RepID=B9TGZ0_RICCO|nr:conserved hypothetical protein [Ricinus communis]